MIELNNEARATGRNCGSRGYFPAAPPLKFSAQLRCASRKHAEDMARRNYFSHNTKGSGQTASERITASGFIWSTSGENIAAGYDSPDATSEGWLKSDGHCAGIMNANFKEVGVGFFSYPDSPYKNYWAENFGAR